MIRLTISFISIFCLIQIFSYSQNPAKEFSTAGFYTLKSKQRAASKPLFRDPVYDGAADPTVIWNKLEKKWFMFYTNRRANDTLTTGVAWVHGTRIGIAESSDNGVTWKYWDTADIQYRLGEFTHWAPEVFEYNNLYHMYLTYVPGIFNDWKHPRNIVHLTSTDLLHWKYVSTLKLSTDKVIDACVYQMPEKPGECGTIMNLTENQSVMPIALTYIIGQIKAKL